MAQKQLEKKRRRTAVPYVVQVQVFYRDGWLCRWCHRPVVFAPAFRLIKELVQDHGYSNRLAYFHKNWSRADAPLLDHLGAVIDHVEAHSKGGAHDESNFVVSCNKCNARKNSRDAKEFKKDHPDRPVCGKHGEPKHWDGLVSLFLMLAEQGIALTAVERQWEMALRAYLRMNENVH